jgi:hypothetical protein
MALKFRRGTTAQQSGSLAFGEPYVNTTLGTLLIGGPNGDIVLSATGTGSTGNFGAISGSGLDITGNARIGGNLTLGGTITIGDATTDNVVVNADLSSSIIPNNDNAFDLGSISARYRAIYANTISGSTLEIKSGSTTELKISNTTSPVNGYHLIHYDNGSFAIHNSRLNQSVLRIDSGSATDTHTHLFGDLFNTSGSIYSTNLYLYGGEVSASTINGIGNASTYSSSVASRLATVESTNTTQTTNITAASASAAGAFASASAFSASAAVVDAGQDTLISSLRTNILSASVFTTFSTSVDSRLDSIELVSASAAAALNSFSASNAVTDNTQTTNITAASASAAGAFASASAFSASAAVVDAGQDTLIASLRTNILSASVFTTFSTSVDSRLDSVELVSASAASALNSFSASNAATDATQTTNISTATAAAAGAFASASAFSASAAVVDAAQDVLIASLRTNVVSSSVFTTFSTSVDSRLDTVELLSASAATAYAKVGSTNTFNGNQTISGSLFVTQDLVLGGSASIQHITSSQLNIGDNIITVNTINPTVRFGGLAVIDSGSAGISGSLLYDSVEDEWVFVHRGNGTNVTSSHVLMGPATFDNLGNETYLTNNRIPKGTGVEHLNDSNITDTGTLITLGSNTSVTGTLVATGTSLVSASAQVDITSTTGYSTFSSSVASTISNLGSTYATDAELSAVSSAMATRDNGQDTTISTLSSSVASRLGTLETKDITITLTGDVTGTGTITDLGNVSFATTVAANSVALGTDTTGDYVASLVAGTNITLSNNSGEGATPSIGLTNNAITIAGTSTALGGSITAATILGGTGVISGSAGLPAGLVSGSSQITASVFGVVSGDITITAAGVATIGANSVALGTDTTGNYMSDVSAGTGVSVSHTPGEGSTATISIGQAVGTTSNVTFGNVTATGTVSGSTFTGLGNLTTYSSSVASRLVTLEGKDFTITLTGDVTGTGTVTDLGNISFATTIAANSVALGTDTTGDYVASMTAGTGITVGTATGEGSTPVITNTGVTSNVAGTGITVSGGTGAVTITNSDRGSSQNIFKNIAVSGQSTVVADSNDDTLTLVAGSNVTITTNATTDTITIASTDTNTVTTNIAGTGVSVSSGTGNSTISIGQAVATSDNVRFNSLGIGMAASATAGRIDAANDIVAFSSSDIRFKENITPIENALDKISKISGNTYDWKEENKAEHGYEGNDVGVIAQEIEAVLPQLVQTRENGYKAVKYDKLVALLIEGIKEQQTQIHSLTLEIEKLKESKGL